MSQLTGSRYATLAVSLLAGAAVMASSACAKLGIGGAPDVSMAPPEHGIQLVAGPFTVPAGDEVQRNFYIKAPNDRPLDIHKFEIRMNKGSHHFNIFRSNIEDMPDGL